MSPMRQEPPRKTTEFSCLFTKHLTQKRKTWQDGKLVVHASSRRVILYREDVSLGSDSRSVDECELPLTNAPLREGQKIETEKYLIEVQGPWKAPSESTQIKIIHKPLISSGMKRVLSQKFRRVETGRFVPSSQRQENRALKRRLPLQPGELARRYYQQNHSENHQMDINGQHLYENSKNSASLQQQELRMQTESSFTHRPRNSPNSLCETAQSSEINDDTSSSSHQETVLQKNILENNRSFHQIRLPPQVPHSLTSKEYGSEVSTKSNREASKKSCNADSFRANQFNPSDFYGEEEEEQFAQSDNQFEWDETLSSAAHKRQNQVSLPDSFEVQKPLPASQRRRIELMDKHSDQERERKTGLDSCVSKNGAMTAQELLNMFGEDEEDLCNMQKSSRNKQQSSNVASPNEGACQFVLPPPSDSSSSESEDND